VTEGVVPGWLSHLVLLVGLGWIAVALVQSERTSESAEPQVRVAA
jgi:hypothetical protein